MRKQEEHIPIREPQSFPWFVTIGFALIMWLTASAVALYGHPEVNFWTEVFRQKNEAAQKAKEESSQPTIYVAGGSSCSFSIHPDVLTEETGLPAFNMGGSAAMGYRYLINVASSHLRSGDVLIIMVEPGIFRGQERSISTIGRRVALRENGLGQYPFAIGNHPSQNLMALRPGAKFLGTLAAKIVRGGPLYQYSINDIQQNSVLTFQASDPNRDIETASPRQHWMNDEVVIQDLKALARFAEERQISIYYALPWECFAPEAIGLMRAEHAAYLKKISHYLPVLIEEEMGVISDNSLFIDTGFHLKYEAGQMRTRILARALRKQLSESQTR